MNGIEIIASAILGTSGALQIVTSGAAAYAMKAKRKKSIISGTPSVSVLRPVCGLENNIEATLRTTFETTWHGKVELLFCVDREDDPIVPVVRGLISEYPSVEARLLVGRDHVSGNPKLNNLVKGWKEAKHEFVLMADSNVLLPADYIERLFARWDDETGLVTSPPVGVDATNMWGSLECGFLNTYQGRWQLSSDTFENGYAQGKMLFWRKDILDAAGGPEALGAEMAEDVASTKVVRAAGKKVRLLNQLMPQPIGERDFKSVWSRQVRWAKVRRMGFPAVFCAEILAGVGLPMLMTLILTLTGLLSWWWLLAVPALWFGTEYAVASLAGWPRSLRDVASWVIRDAMLPLIWVSAWRGNSFEWRGNAMDASEVTAKARG
ncbi:glycosyltransferase [Marivivens donghaensis]|uniref:Glycosyltransferase n=1 Tax=Marivivens donghaensis TaxID=1699413 RepID=A0ABX0VSZ1_9RHOB|nr:ceramide glucosyltransferase [Marivivens donghaensis]NIY71000.1 glycosyltransferase [Marivivens donghaensis]